MSSLTSIFSIASRALRANQTGMDITGSNISNAQNPNYSRQLVDFTGGEVINSGDILLGMGVEIASIERARDQIFDVKIWQEKGSFGQLESGGRYAKMIENNFNDLAGGGLAGLLDEFWNSWTELANHPQSGSVRTSLRSKAQQLAGKLNSMDAELRQIGSLAVSEIEGVTKQVNQISKNILKINQQIQQTRTLQGVDNSLLDQRDALLDQLSSYVDLSVSYGVDGVVSVYTGGRVLIDRSQAFEFKVNTESQGSHNQVYLSLYGTEAVELRSGSLRGLVDSANANVYEPLAHLDRIARSLAEEVNAVHRGFYTLSGETGKDFFVATGTTAGSISLTAEIQKKGQNIAISKDSQSGDGSGALDIARIRDKKLETVGSVTIGDSYSQIVAMVGQLSRTIEDEMETQQGVITMLENQRQSVMGVSLEEEMINMIQYQNAFEAASRVIVTVDEMMRTVIDMKR